MSIFYFNLLNRHKKLVIALFLMGVSVFEIQCFRYHDKSKHRKSDEHVFLCGKSLEMAYARASKANSNMLKNISACEIMEYSKNAYTKKEVERNIEEKISLKLVSSATKLLAKKIVKKYLKSEVMNMTVLIFGGILQGGGDFLKNLLLQYVDEINNSGKKIKIIFSEMGDERAILGAVKYAESKLKSCQNSSSKYAIGIDIGGTNIRIGLVDLQKYSLVGELVKQPVFVNNNDKNKLYSFKNQIKSAFLTSKRNKNYKTYELEYFLKDKASRAEYELDRKSVE